MQSIYKHIRDALALIGVLFVAAPLLTNAPSVTKAYGQSLGEIIGTAAPVQDALSMVQGTVYQGKAALSSMASGSSSTAYLVAGHGPIFLPGADTDL